MTSDAELNDGFRVELATSLSNPASIPPIAGKFQDSLRRLRGNAERRSLVNRQWESFSIVQRGANSGGVEVG